MFPMLFATSFHPSMRCFPVFPKRSIDWIPVNVAAQAISELLVPEQGCAMETGTGGDVEGGPTTHDTYRVHNIVNPHPIPWSSLISMVQSSSFVSDHQLEEVSMKEWVRRLSVLADEGLSGKEVPGLRLLSFFEKMANEEDEENKSFDTGKTREMSVSLRECGAVCAEWVHTSLEVWRKDGFLQI
jgi:hypothetical protein